MALMVDGSCRFLQAMDIKQTTLTHISPLQLSRKVSTSMYSRLYDGQLRHLGEPVIPQLLYFI